MDENKLIQLAINGNGDAFTQLMQAHERRMYAVALRICGNPEDAQDCLTDAMLRIYRSLSTFNGDSSFSTWTYRIVSNICLDLLRSKKKRNYVSIDELYENGWAPVDTGETPEMHTLRVERAEYLYKCIGELPEPMRDALILRDIEGLSYEEIADILKISIGTVKSRISRAREQLRKKILEKPELFNLTVV